jgi:uncharacterized protein (DUF1330 family)
VREELDVTVYVIVQLKTTDRTAYDRYQVRFSTCSKKLNARLLSADETPAMLEGVWDRDKLILMSFADEARLSHVGGLAGISGDFERPRSRRTRRRAFGERVCSLIPRHQNGPNPKPNVNGAGA